jgi:hypothetical protein
MQLLFVQNEFNNTTYNRDGLHYILPLVTQLDCDSMQEISKTLLIQLILWEQVLIEFVVAL